MPQTRTNMMHRAPRTHPFRLTGFWSFLLLLLFALSMTGCASNMPIRYSGLDSSPQLQANTGKEADRIPYRYAGAADWKHYASAIIEPVVIYHGADNQFGDMTEDDRRNLALYMRKKFTQALQTRFRPATVPGPSTLMVVLTLTGAETTTPFLGTFTKFDLGGGPYNIVQSIRGKEGLFNGSVDYAVEIYDASTKALLYAYVAKQYPNAMNIGASIGALSAAKVGIDKGAEEFAAMLE